MLVVALGFVLGSLKLLNDAFARFHLVLAA
jgi:hypothetical protein